MGICPLKCGDSSAVRVHQPVRLVALPGLAETANQLHHQSRQIPGRFTLYCHGEGPCQDKPAPVP